MRMNKILEKPRLLGILKDAGFDVPDFLFMSGEDFDQGNFNKLKDFLDHSCSSFKVIVRSANPLEDRFKGGTFDSLETNCDVNGIFSLWHSSQCPDDGRDRLYGPDSLAADGNGIDVTGMKKDSWIQNHFLE